MRSQCSEWIFSFLIFCGSVLLDIFNCLIATYLCNHESIVLSTTSFFVEICLCIEGLTWSRTKLRQRYREKGARGKGWLERETY